MKERLNNKVFKIQVGEKWDEVHRVDSKGFDNIKFWTLSKTLLQSEYT